MLLAIATGLVTIGVGAVLLVSARSAPSFDHLLVLRPPEGAAHRLHVAIAATPASQARGLSGLDTLPPDAAMAFVFRRPTGAAFWMKDTRVPLSIAFWDGRGRIVAILGMTPCRTDQCRRYRSPVPYVGAVEANRGYFSAHGIGVGSRVELERP